MVQNSEPVGNYCRNKKLLHPPSSIGRSRCSVFSQLLLSIQLLNYPMCILSGCGLYLILKSVARLARVISCIPVYFRHTLPARLTLSTLYLHITAHWTPSITWFYHTQVLSISRLILRDSRAPTSKRSLSVCNLNPCHTRPYPSVKTTPLTSH